MVRFRAPLPDAIQGRLMTQELVDADSDALVDADSDADIAMTQRRDADSDALVLADSQTDVLGVLTRPMLIQKLILTLTQKARC